MAVTVQTMVPPSATRCLVRRRYAYVRANVTFDGSATGGVGTPSFTIFPITGRVWIHRFLIFITADLVEAAASATVGIGSAGNTDGLNTAGAIGAFINTNEWWGPGYAQAGVAGSVGVAGTSPSQFQRACAQDITCTISGQAVTTGSLVIDCWYTPITHDGRLS